MAADEPSRRLTHNESKLRDHLRRSIKTCFSPKVDLFAGDWNTLCRQYCSEAFFEDKSGRTICVCVDGMKYRTRELCYASPPRFLLPGFIIHSVPFLPRLMLICHDYGVHEHFQADLNSQFQYRLCIGRRGRAACLTPGHKRTQDIREFGYYRNYSEVFGTFIYFKGVPLSRIIQFRNLILSGEYDDFVRRIFTRWYYRVRTNQCRIGLIQRLNP